MSDSEGEEEEEEAPRLQKPSVSLANRAQRRAMNRTTPSRTIINTSQCKYGIVRRCAADMGWAEAGEGAAWHVYWTDLSVSHERVRDLGPLQKLNHFPDMTSICHKASSAEILKRMRRFFPREYQFFPQSWTLPRDLGLLHKFLSAPPEQGAPPPTVIVKPNKGCQVGAPPQSEMARARAKEGECAWAQQ